MGLVKMLFLRHAYSVLFGWVLVEQAGVPIPSVPLMLAAGTMSAAHKVHLALILSRRIAGMPHRGHDVVVDGPAVWQPRSGCAVQDVA